ncbi:MAG: aminotransferase class V-fold PLP-dependent enzyme [Pseudomonadota bacterium]
MTYALPTSRADALSLDASDSLAPAAAAFSLPTGMIYLDGHSLGPASHLALAAGDRATKDEWANGLIRSWNDADWINLPRTVGAKLARLIGVAADDVLVCDSVSINLYKLAKAALELAAEKRVMVEEDEFPTDQYMAQGLSQQTGAAFQRVPSGQAERALAMGGILLKSVVNYRTGEVENIARLEAIAAQTGALIVWDLSHATGCVDLDLKAWGARLATGCTYKYLNGGPGAPAFVYVEAALAQQLRNPLPGWFGHAQPFEFEPDYHPVHGAARFAAGTPPVLSLRTLDGALDVFSDIAIANLGQKARALGDVCLWWAEQLALETISPGIGAMRGGHVSLLHDDGYAIVQALIARNIIPDFRAPDAMRFGFSPLYVRFVDVWDAMVTLEDILRTRAWDQPQFKVRSAVT